MLEIAGLSFGWEAIAGVAGAVAVALRARRVKKCLVSWTEFGKAVYDARSEKSPGGKTFTQEETEKLIKEGSEALIDSAPLISRLLGARK